MLNDFIGGGQIFLHKIRMFMQVLDRSCLTAFIITILLLFYVSSPKISLYDWSAAKSYQKAILADEFDNSIRPIRRAAGIKGYHITKIDVQTKSGIYRYNIDPKIVKKDTKLKKSYQECFNFLISQFILALEIFAGVFVLIFAIWSKFGRDATTEQHIRGAVIKSDKEVSSYLKSKKLASNLRIGNMCLVKDSETKHFLITGSTGSGKTNLIHNLLPQIFANDDSAIILDQTGEMIARYYDEARGDIIFNPLDERSYSWDFWNDTNKKSYEDIGESDIFKFAEILFGAEKASRRGGDPFWDNAAKIVFCSIVEYLQNTEKDTKDKTKAYKELKNMCSNYSLARMKSLLKGSDAYRFLDSNEVTAGSILAVLSAKTMPLRLLSQSDRIFSLREYFQKIARGEKVGKLFLSSTPHLREITRGLIGGIFELTLARLMSINPDKERHVWFIIDELASLGALKGFGTLMSEGRKYGACVMAATQSFNQILDNFGQYGANHLVSQFATKFMFRSDDPISAKIISDVAGEREYQHQQKNTSFGANEFRDGISYTEQQKHKKLITADMLSSLKTHECFVSLPEPKIRIAKITVPICKDKDKSPYFVEVNRTEMLEIECEEDELNNKCEEQEQNDQSNNHTEEQEVECLASQKEQTNQKEARKELAYAIH